MHHRFGALEGAPAGVGVADVSPDQLDAEGVEVPSHVLLAVQQHVQHADVAARVEQLVHHEGADIPGSAGDHDRHRATGLAGAVRGTAGAWPEGRLAREPAGASSGCSSISRGFTCSNSKIAFS